MRFSLETEDGDEIELVENGKNILVTKENIDEYCRLVAKYHLIDQVQKETREFMRGFYKVLPKAVVEVFETDELDFLLEGVQEIQLADWKAHTLYKGELTSKHKIVKWFWEIMDTLDQN